MVRKEKRRGQANESDSVQLPGDHKNNKKLLRGVQGGGFLEKSPLAAGGVFLFIFSIFLILSPIYGTVER